MRRPVAIRRQGEKVSLAPWPRATLPPGGYVPWSKISEFYRERSDRLRGPLRQPPLGEDFYHHFQRDYSQKAGRLSRLWATLYITTNDTVARRQIERMTDYDK